jgi:uncharacterized protein (TIGR02996 family)
MTDDLALLAAIRAAPDDDAPRLVYADWLDEHDQPERAEFIRVQCELARRDDPALRRREVELLAKHHDALAGPLAAPHLRFRFERGFITGFQHDDGLFFHEADAEAIRQGIRHTFLEFRLNGKVRLANDRDLQTAVQHLNHGLSWSGPYTIDAVSFPAVLRFVYRTSLVSIDYSGTTDGLTINFEGRSRQTGYRCVESYRYLSDVSPET